MRISVSMITLNEARHIGRALSSCTFADEIVVVDGGSTDGTLEILSSFDRVRLVQHPWEGHFGRQRQISLENCTGDWIVRLDADEVFSEEFERGIRPLLESTPPGVVGYKVRKCNLVGSEDFYAKAHDRYEDTPRIWRNNPGVRWERHVHEIPVGLAGEIACWDVYIVHYNIIDRERFERKGRFYSNIPGSGFERPEDLYYREYDIQPRPRRSRVSPHVPPFETEGEEGRGLKVAIVRGPNLNPWEMQNYEALTDRFDVTAYTTTEPSFDIRGIKLPVVKLPPHPDHPAYMMGLEFALFDKDLIYTADTTWIFSHQAVMIKEKFGTPVVCLQWENIPFAYEEDERIRLAKRRVRQEADHFVAVTERAREALMLEGVPPERITVIPMGIDIERFRPERAAGLGLRRELGIDPEEKVVLFTGRIVWEKGIYDLVHAARLVLRRIGGDAVRFVVVGRGPELAAVKQRVRELSMEDSFLFMESCPYHEIHRMYNLADLFVLPSISTRMWKEQFGMVLIEAMACGVAVVSTHSGSIAEVVGDAGVLVHPNDPGPLSSALIELLRDDEKRRALGGRGRERVESRFNARRVSERIGELFEALLEERAGDRKAKATSVAGPAVSSVSDGGYHGQERNDVETVIPGGIERVLDVGCGEGILGRKLLRKGATEVVGVDIVPEVCRKAEENLTRVICGDIEEIDLPFDEGYFDCMIFADVLEHLRDPLAALRRLKRYLADHGTIVASIPNVRYFKVLVMLAEGRWEYRDRGILDRTHLRFFTRKEMELLFAGAGLEITGITENLDPSYGLIQDPLAGEISLGRISLKDLSPEELKDLFVFQYLIRAQKAEQRLKGLKTAVRAEDLEEGRRVLEGHLELHPADLEALYRHAEVCYRLGLVEKALESLDRLLVFEPERPEALALRKKME